MPVLPITADDLGPKRNKYTLGLIESVMYFPRDESARVKNELVIQEHIWTTELISSGGKMEFDGREVVELLKAARLLPSFEQQSENVKLPFLQGVWAGGILCAAIAASDDGDHFNFASARVSGGDVLERAGLTKHMGLSNSKIKQAWGAFRPVAHLWAAWLARIDPDTAPFPCIASELPDFLDLAEDLRQRGEVLDWKQSKETVLNRRDTWAVPESLLPLIPN
ncbi:MAG: hypothetical protein IIB62_13055 [Proteobacteria bacterium]|nr:hypothetical protein [Pseudomonadota bacterium]